MKDENAAVMICLLGWPVMRSSEHPSSGMWMKGRQSRFIGMMDISW